MDKNEEIILRILKDAEKGMLSKRKHLQYGCKSESEAQKFIDALIYAKSIIKHEIPYNAARDGHGRELIRYENDPVYSITQAGKDDISRLEKT